MKQKTKETIKEILLIGFILIIGIVLTVLVNAQPYLTLAIVLIDTYAVFSIIKYFAFKSAGLI